jgi:hypothetical protein
MTRAEIKQNKRMKWILFYIFVTIFVIIVAGTIMVVFFGYGKPTEVEREILFKVFIGEIGIAVLALFKLLFGLKKKEREPEEKPIPKVGGKYKYELTCSENKAAFMAECLVKQDGRVLAFNGERKKECIGHKKRRVSYHWFSHWAELCVDNKIRLDYSITNNNGGLRGYAILDLGKKSGRGMVGEFHLLGSPYTYGTVKFKKI